MAESMREREGEKRRPGVKTSRGGDAARVSLVLLASIALTLVFQVVLPANLRLNDSSDYVSFYEPVARSILAGNGVVDLEGVPATRYPPGYPVILAGAFALEASLGLPDGTGVSAVILLGTALASVFIYLIGRSLWGPGLGLLPAVVWMTYPFTLWLTKQPNSEIPFVAALYASFFVLWRACRRGSRGWVAYAGAGVLLGFAALIRPLGLFALLSLLVVLWLSHRHAAVALRAFLAVAVLVGFVAAILPWEAWAYSSTGKVLLLSQGDVPSVRDGLTFGARSKGYRADFNLPPDVVSLMQDAVSQSAEMNSFGEVARFVGEQLQIRPFVVVKLLAIKALRSWYGTDSGRYELFVALLQIPYLLAIIAGIFFAWRRGGFHRDVAVGASVLLLSFWAVTALVLPILRYMTPAIGVSFVVLPALVVQMRKRAPAALPTEVPAIDVLDQSAAEVVPFVTIIMPIRQEAAYIERSLGAVLAQDYPGDRLEVLVVDGMSTDGTREIVARMAQTDRSVRLLDNPSGIVPPGLNIGLREARGEVIIRVDGHCEIARDYVRQCVHYLRGTGAACVGGPIKTIGEDYTAEAVALAMSSTFGVGNSRFRTSEAEGYVDTVAFGAYQREVFTSVGVFDEELVRNQDDEFNFRVTRAGYKIFLTPAIKSLYYSRASLRGLWKQYFQYGLWKLRVVQKHRAIPSPRHAVAPGFVLALIVSLLSPPFTGHPWLAGAVLVPYLVANAGASLLVASRSGWRFLPLLPVTFAIIHLAYGSGFWAGLRRFGFKNYRLAPGRVILDERS